jgi:hypothetical protein
MEGKMEKEIREMNWEQRYSTSKLAKVRMPGEETEVARPIRMDKLLRRLEVQVGKEWKGLGPLPTDVTERLVKYLQKG